LIFLINLWHILGLASHGSEAVPQLRLLVAGFLLRRPGFEPWSGHVGFVVDKAALGQVFLEYFGFPCQSFHTMLHVHLHPSIFLRGLYNRPVVVASVILSL
jgi:hypothetical protein